MPKLQELKYETWDGLARVLKFIDMHPEDCDSYATVITGRNGSHKSTILSELVKALALAEYSSNIKVTSLPVDGLGAPSVICASGSVADRFPSKERGGSYSEYMVPNYIYLGQRVGNNLLSKKRPLDTALTFAMDENYWHRFNWSFYSRAFQFSKVYPCLDIKFSIKPSVKFENGLLDELLANRSGATSKTQKKSGRLLPPAMAEYLLNEFDYDEFSELDGFIRRRVRGGAVSVQLNEDGVKSQNLSATCIRLGLLADIFSLDNAQVFPRSGGKPYSVFELSSGEYHMLATLLGLGFSIKSGSVVLIDEPENSLHPQWQQDFMDILLETCDLVKGVHLVVSTHSPLIVASVRAGSTIVDLSIPSQSQEQALYGASADEILLEQFGVASSRNRSIIDVVQRAVEIFERAGSIVSDDLKKDLSQIKNALREGDPLIDVIAVLLEEVGE